MLFGFAFGIRSSRAERPEWEWEVELKWLALEWEVKEATSGDPNTVDEVRGAAREPLSPLKGPLGSLDGCEGAGIRTGVTYGCRGKCLER